MATDTILTKWNSDFEGVMEAPKGKILLGDQPSGLSPYNLLFGALASCFYATFLSIADKKKLSFTSATVEVSGKKREDKIATLEYVKMILTIKDASDQKQILRSAELGAEYCSIHATISKVAKIDLEVRFD
ncbi:MAG: OsmC family protein [Candidatus Izemoplasmatales bacterium]|jgi:putative redox protein|nr:OsmC family protein [Acholeplasmataceae bacterium]